MAFLFRHHNLIAYVVANVCVLAAPIAATAQSEPPRGGSRFFSDVADDYRHFVSLDTLQWLSLGGVMTLVVAEADEVLRVATEDEAATLTRTLDAGGTGATYGNIALQLPVAAGWWAIAHATGNERSAAAGRDLLRAQISAMSWTYVFKFTANRTRPNGDPR